MILPRQLGSMTMYLEWTSLNYLKKSMPRNKVGGAKQARHSDQAHGSSTFTCYCVHVHGMSLTSNSKFLNAVLQIKGYTDFSPCFWLHSF